jgi:hypothetical protein
MLVLYSCIANGLLIQIRPLCDWQKQWPVGAVFVAFDKQYTMMSLSFQQTNPILDCSP